MIPFFQLTYLFYEIQKLFSKNKVHTMDSDDVIQYLKDDKITVQCLKIRLLNLCQNKLISITDDAEREIAYINIPFFEETDEYDSLFKATV